MGRCARCNKVPALNGNGKPLLKLPQQPQVLFQQVNHPLLLSQLGLTACTQSWRCLST